MYGSEKVKSLTGIAGLIPALTLLSVMIITIILFGESAGFKAAGIAIPFYEPDRMVFSITTPLSMQLGVNRNYFDGSWVSVSMEGAVSVSISQKDYLKYKDTYSFDQLCAQLGAVFVNFLELYKRGEGSRIIESLNSLNLNPIIE